MRNPLIVSLVTAALFAVLFPIGSQNGTNPVPLAALEGVLGMELGLCCDEGGPCGTGYSESCAKVAPPGDLSCPANEVGSACGYSTDIQNDAICTTEGALEDDNCDLVNTLGCYKKYTGACYNQWYVFFYNCQCGDYDDGVWTGTVKKCTAESDPCGQLPL